MTKSASDITQAASDHGRAQPALSSKASIGDNLIVRSALLMGVGLAVALSGCSPASPTISPVPTAVSRQSSAEHARFVAESRPQMYAATAPLYDGTYGGTVSHLHESSIATDNERYIFKANVRRLGLQVVQNAAETLCRLREKDFHSAGVRAQNGDLKPLPLTRFSLPNGSMNRNGIVAFEFQCGNLI